MTEELCKNLELHKLIGHETSKFMVFGPLKKLEHKLGNKLENISKAKIKIGP